MVIRAMENNKAGVEMRSNYFQVGFSNRQIKI